MTTELKNPDVFADQHVGCGPLLHLTNHVARPLKQQVFEFVRGQGQTARADIVAALDTSAASTTTLTADLIAEGYLEEVHGVVRGVGRGRPKVALQVVPEAAYVIGIKLAFKQHSAVLTDFAGTVISDATLSIETSHDVRRSVGELLEQTETLIGRLLAKAGKTTTQISAVGIGLPGIVDHMTGRVVWSSLLKNRNEDLKTAFEGRIGLPMLLDNDANMLTLAELWFGEGRAMSDFAVITIERGVGMGLVLDNELYRGAHGMGLELGHTKVQIDGALCQCGQRGCIEAYLADYALAREAATALDQPANTPRSQEELLAGLLVRANAGDAAAQAIFKRAARVLSLGLSNVVQLFDPALIILSGGQMQNDYFYHEDVLNAMQAMTLKDGRRPCKVVVNGWSDLVWARGASALALSTITTALIGAGRAA